MIRVINAGTSYSSRAPFSRQDAVLASLYCAFLNGKKQETVQEIIVSLTFDFFLHINIFHLRIKENRNTKLQI